MKYFTFIKNDALEYLLKWEKAHGLEWYYNITHLVWYIFTA